MAKEFKIFFSWQSDLSANQTTRFIEESIEIAQTLLPDSIILVPDEAVVRQMPCMTVTEIQDVGLARIKYRAVIDGILNVIRSARAVLERQFFRFTVRHYLVEIIGRIVDDKRDWL